MKINDIMSFKQFINESSEFLIPKDSKFYKKMVELTGIKNLTKEDMIDGPCHIWAEWFYLNNKNSKIYLVHNNIEFQNSEHWHIFIKYENKYFDGFNNSGVENYKDLEWFSWYGNIKFHIKELKIKELKNLFK